MIDVSASMKPAYNEDRNNRWAIHQVTGVLCCVLAEQDNSQRWDHVWECGLNRQEKHVKSNFVFESHSELVVVISYFSCAL